jgi:hypothetical protein
MPELLHKYRARERRLLEGEVSQASSSHYQNHRGTQERLEMGRAGEANVKAGAEAFNNLGAMSIALSEASDYINTRERRTDGSLPRDRDVLLQDINYFNEQLILLSPGLNSLNHNAPWNPLAAAVKTAEAEVERLEDKADAALWRSEKHFQANASTYHDIAVMMMWHEAGLTYNDGTVTN